jgi:hypothetical protein
MAYKILSSVNMVNGTWSFNVFFLSGKNISVVSGLFVYPNHSAASTV